MARISSPQRVYRMTNQNSASRTRAKTIPKVDARAEERGQPRRRHEIGGLDRIHGRVPVAEDQEADDLGRDGVQQQRGDGLVDQADRSQIAGDECPQRAAEHAEQHHERQQDPGGQSWKVSAPQVAKAAPIYSWPSPPTLIRPTRAGGPPPVR